MSRLRFNPLREYYSFLAKCVLRGATGWLGQPAQGIKGAMCTPLQVTTPLLALGFVIIHPDPPKVSAAELRKADKQLLPGS